MTVQRTNWFDAANYAILSLIGLMTLLPFVHVLAKSVSSTAAVTAGKVGFWPQGFQLANYAFLFSQQQFLNSVKVTLIVATVGTVLCVLITVMGAYPLSKPEFRGRKLILILYVFSMLFYGGIVPSYMLMKYLNLIDTIWAMIIPYLVVQFNLLVVKTFFEELPESVEESAKIDGASHFTILFRIVVPMSTPVIATVSLFSLVIYWNNFFHPLLFINTPSLKPLALYLYEMITSANDVLSRLSLSDQMSLAAEGVVSTTIMVTSLPIFALYPFVQRFLVQGLTLGSVKG